MEHKYFCLHKIYKFLIKLRKQPFPKDIHLILHTTHNVTAINHVFSSYILLPTFVYDEYLLLDMQEYFFKHKRQCALLWIDNTFCNTHKRKWNKYVYDFSACLFFYESRYIVSLLHILYFHPVILAYIHSLTQTHKLRRFIILFRSKN